MSSRSSGVDVARVLAPIGIVWIHASEGPHKEWARPCLSFFVASVAYFGWVHLQRTGLLQAYIRNRSIHLLVPFVVWCGIHAALFGVRYLLTGAIPPHLNLWGPLFGTNYHLWFLPFAAAIPLLLALVHALLSTRALARYSDVVGVLILGLAPVLAWFGPNIPMPIFGVPALLPLGNWLEELPSVLLGMALGMLSCRRGVPALGTALALFGVALVWKCVDSSGSYFPNSVLGTAALALSLAWRPSVGPMWERLAKLSFFIYLVHLIPLSVLRGPLSAFVTDGILITCILTTCAWALSVLAGLACLKLRLGWPIVP